MKLLVVLAVLLVVVTNGFKTTIRRQFTSSLSSSNTAVTSTPTSSTPQETVSNILNQLRAIDPAKVFETISKVVQKPQRLQYTASMMTRFSFFLLQGVSVSFLRSSAKVSEGANQPAQRTPIDPLKIVNALSAAILSDDDSDVYVQSITDDLNKQQVISDQQTEFFKTTFKEIINLMKKEMKNIEEGIYKYPYDLDPTNPAAISQWSPLTVAQQLREYYVDRQLVLDRQETKNAFEVAKSFVSSKYPAYYLQNFHYQSDGWLSTKSANLYDYQVESLFLGTADAMRRQILPSMNNYLKNVDTSSTKVLDLACGTGRFSSFVLDNYRDLDLTLMDASPQYLERAKSMLSKYDQVKYAEGFGEEMPFPDGSFDAVTCVYMFHELPAEIRVKVVSEMKRVLKPGGKVFFVDSAQRGEVKHEQILEGFTVIAHEPYYLDYVTTDLKELFTGFTLDNQEVNWVTKCVTFTKE
jgi:ubiquinone/menaquinone biosynthesis C-methylase UbiE